MDLIKNGELLRRLRKEKGFTQKEVANKLGVVPKTISKWETGHGFPDITTLSSLADILSVSERTLLSGVLAENKKDVGNMQRTKFYICPNCGCCIQGLGECQIICCGKPLIPLTPQTPNDEHQPKLTEVEDEFYLEIPHEMSKSHYIGFVWYLDYNKVLSIRLYPEQDCAVRLPKVYSGRILYYCNQHGLFELILKKR